MSTAARIISAAQRRPALPRRLWLHLQRAVLLWNTNSTEQYMAACERDGIMDGETIRAWRAHLCAERVRLAVLEAALRGEVQP